jgi:16S rRNA (guanine1207-N2)-methyltransferase
MNGLLGRAPWGALGNTLLVEPGLPAQWQDLQSYAKRLVVLESHYHAYAATKSLLQGNAMADLLPNGPLLPHLRWDYQSVLVNLSAQKKWDLQLLYALHQHLPAQCKLFFYGSNDTGVKSIAKLLKIGDPWFIAAGGRIYEWSQRLVMPDEPWTPYLEHPLQVVLPSGEVCKCDWQSAASGFSPKQIDPGSLFLAHALPKSLWGKTVLDAGAGNGVLSWVASLLGATSIYCVENHLTSLLGCTANLQKLRVKHHAVWSSLESYKGPCVDVIISNPPFHQGKNEWYGVARQWLMAFNKRLNAGGMVYLVAPAHLGYAREAVSAGFEIVEVVADGSYKVYWLKKTG